MEIGNGPKMVSESTVSNSELSECYFCLTEFQGENSVSSFQPFIDVPKRTHSGKKRNPNPNFWSGYSPVG